MITFYLQFFIFISPLSGDGGIDFIGIYKRYTLLVQCKNQEKKINVEQIRSFIGAIEKYFKKSTFAIFVTNGTNHYTFYAEKEAKDAQDRQIKILLTDYQNLHRDILGFHLPELEEDSELIKRFDELNEKIEKITNNNRNQNNLIFLILILFIIIIIIII